MAAGAAPNTQVAVGTVNPPGVRVDKSEVMGTGTPQIDQSMLDRLRDEYDWDNTY